MVQNKISNPPNSQFVSPIVLRLHFIQDSFSSSVDLSKLSHVENRQQDRLVVDEKLKSGTDKVCEDSFCGQTVEPRITVSRMNW